VEIGPHAILEIDSFAHVNHIAGRVAIDITARLGRERGKDALKMLGNFHRLYFTRICLGG
jgi:hypothetical protein